MSHRVMSTETISFTIIMGDLNAKVGLTNDKEEKALGPYRIGERNDRGERLLEYIARRNLIGNTWFKKSTDRYWTWESPNTT